MPVPTARAGEMVMELPPLILHPFNENVPPATLLENSKAAMMLAGLSPEDGTAEEELHRRVMSGRYGEVRMLYFLGKDVFRWLDQCVEAANRDGDAPSPGLKRQSFANLLISRPPESVKAKLQRWGVADYSSIFARAVGLKALFREPPTVSSLSEDFLRNYSQYADALYRCYMDADAHLLVTPAEYQFELYASGEYSRMLETEWGNTAEPGSGTA